MLEIFQQTIAAPITFEGVGLHTGKNEITIHKDKKTRELYSEEQISEEII